MWIEGNQLWDRERRGGGKIGVGKRRKRKEPEGKVSKKIYRISLSGSPKSGSPTLWDGDPDKEEMERKEKKVDQILFCKTRCLSVDRNSLFKKSFWTEAENFLDKQICFRNLFVLETLGQLRPRSCCVSNLISHWEIQKQNEGNTLHGSGTDRNSHKIPSVKVDKVLLFPFF